MAVQATVPAHMHGGPAVPTAESIQLLLERILASQTFAQAESLRRLLRYLVENAQQGRADQLKEYVLGVEVFERGAAFDSRSDAIVRVQAGRLRARLTQFYEGAGYAETILIELPRGSYVPVFRTRELAAMTADSAIAASPHANLVRRTLVAGLIVTAICVLSVLAWRLRPAPPTNSIGASDPSIAVLPFSNLSPDPGQDYFCDGVVEEITDALARIPGLRVISRTSAFQFKGKSVDVREVARQLNVGAVLEGSVRRAADRIRITAQLVNGADGYHIWSEIYERQEPDMFAVQQEIARAIATTLTVRGAGRPGVFSLHAGTRSAEAHELYLRAIREHRGGADSIARAMQYLHQALDADPNYAPAYAGIASTYMRMAFATSPPREVVPKAREAALKALQLDPTLPDAHIALAHVKWSFDWDWDGAEQEYRRALEIDPNSSAARQTYAVFLSNRNRPAEALQQMALLHMADPLSPGGSTNQALIYFNSRQFDRVIEQCRASLSALPDMKEFYYWMGRAYAEKSQFGDALAALEKMPPPTRERFSGLGTMGSTYARAGQQARARELLAQAMEQSGLSYVPAVDIALIQLWLGDRDRSVESLGKAVFQHDYGLASLKVSAAWDPLREDPRFHSVLRQIHLE